MSEQRKITERLSVTGPDRDGDYELYLEDCDCDSERHSFFINRAEADALIRALSALPGGEAAAKHCPNCDEQLVCQTCYGRPLYDPSFGDERVCQCGHDYYRHFDSYDNKRPVGCKYCGCPTFIEPAASAPSAPTPEPGQER